MQTLDLDHTDRRILGWLQKEPGINAAELGEKISLSQSAVWRRMQRLRDEGVIKDQPVKIDREKYVILPKFFVAKQGGAFEVNVGGLVQRRLGQDSRHTRENTSSSFYIGVFYRVNDAIVPTVLVEYKRMLSLGISYDVNISKLSDHTIYRGGMELAIAYHGVFNDSRTKLQRIEGVK